MLMYADLLPEHALRTLLYQVAKVIWKNNVNLDKGQRVRSEEIQGEKK
jgi:hypothetical protein